MAVEHDIVPLDGAEMFQQGGIDSGGERDALAQDPGDLPRLQINDARQLAKTTDHCPPRGCQTNFAQNG